VAEAMLAVAVPVLLLMVVVLAWVVPWPRGAAGPAASKGLAGG
jgi:hypothetical protein